MEVQKALRFNQKCLDLCEMDKGLMGLERYEGESLKNFHFWVNYPLRKKLNKKNTKVVLRE